MHGNSEWKRWCPLILTQGIEVSHAGAGRGDSAQCRFARGSRRAGNGKDCEHTIAHEFQHLAAKRMHRTGNPVEPRVEHRDHHGRLCCLGKSGEVAQIRTQQGSLYRFADARVIAPACTRAALLRPR